MANDTREAGEAAQPSGEATAAEPGNWSPILDAGQGGRSWVPAAWRWSCRERALLFTTAHVLVAFLGLWSSTDPIAASASRSATTCRSATASWPGCAIPPTC